MPEVVKPAHGQKTRQQKRRPNMRKLSFVVAAIFMVTAIGCPKKDDPEKEKPAEEKAEEKEEETAETEEGTEETEEYYEEEVAEEYYEEEEEEVDEYEKPEAVISELEGTVKIRKAGKGDFEAAAKETEVFAGDTVRAGNDGSATLVMWDNSTVAMSPESAVMFESAGTLIQPSATITVLAGAIQLDVPERTAEQGPFLIYSTSAVTAVQGTVLNIAVALNGSTRIGVDDGEVEVTPTANPETDPIKVPKGRYIEVEMGKESGQLDSYADANWNQWLEDTDTQAANQAPQTAGMHETNIERLSETFQTLEEKLEELSRKAEEITQQLEQAGEAENQEQYVASQPQFADSIETMDAVRHGRDSMRSRIAAHAYLLALMQARLEAGVYKVPPAHVQAVAARMASVDRRLPRGWYRSRYYRAHRRRLRRMRPGYYIHHPDGRVLAVRVGVDIPGFYKGIRLKRRPPRARRRSIPGVRGLYYPPRYRGRRVKHAAIRPTDRKAARGWYKSSDWQKRHARRAPARQKHRKQFQKRVVTGRRKTWQARPAAKIRTRPERKRRVVKGRPGKPGVRVRPGDVRVRPGEVRVRPGEVRVKPGDVRVRPGDVRVRPGDRRPGDRRPGDVKGRPGDHRRPGDERVRPGDRRPGEVKGRPGDIRVKPGEVRVRPGEVRVKPGEVRVKPGERKGQDVRKKPRFQDKREQVSKPKAAQERKVQHKARGAQKRGRKGR